MENRQKDGQEILKQKGEEIRTQIEEWAKKNLSLGSDEFIFIDLTLTINKRPVTVIKLTTKTPKLKTSDKAITEEDWEKILSLPLTEKQKAIVRVFKENGNKPLLPAKIDELLSKNGFSIGFSSAQNGSLNQIFCKTKVNYRLRKSGESGYYYDQYLFRFVIVNEE